MTRFEKKCFVASASTHVLLLSSLVLAPLLLVSKQQTITLPVIHFVPSKIVDGAVSGGGSPPPPAPKPEVVVPPVAPSPAPKPAPKTPPPQTQKAVQPAPKPANPTPARTEPAKKRWEQIKPSLDRASASPSQEAVPDRTQAQRAQAEYAARVNSVLNAIGQSISSSTRIEIPGPGGAAFADYAQVVELRYRQAWSPPRDLADNTATVTVTVVIRRNGDVEAFTITRRSRHGALDQSVERLGNIKFIAPFPDGARDQKRTFIINFNLSTQ
jgi:TonB family protein